MGVLGDYTLTGGPDYNLPRQGRSYGEDYSLDRDSHLRAVLGRGLDAILGSGVIWGGEVSPGTGLSVNIASGTIFFLGGVAWELTQDYVFSDLIDGSNIVNTIWVALQRVPAVGDPGEILRQTLDTWNFLVQATATDDPPDATHTWWPLAYVPVNAGAFNGDFNNNPPGKFAYFGPASLSFIPGPLLLSADPEDTNARQVTVQLRDSTNFARLTSRLVRIWLGDDDLGAECASAPSGGITVDSGTLLQSVTTNKHLLVVTNNLGQIQFTVTESTAKTFWVMVAEGDQIESLALPFT